MDSTSDDLCDFTKGINQIANFVTIALYVVFDLTIILSLFSISGALILSICKLYCGRFLIHFAWFLYFFLMLLGFSLGIFLNPMSVALIEVCDYLD